MSGALNIELGPNLQTYFGWLIPFFSPFVVVSRSSDELLECKRSSEDRSGGAGRLAQADHVGQPPAGLLGHYEVASFRALGQRYRRGRPPHVIDVRFPHEWQTGHVRGAQNIPLPEVASATVSLPTGRGNVGHCAAGYRAAIAASILSAHGLRPVLVDAFDNAIALGSNRPRAARQPTTIGRTLGASGPPPPGSAGGSVVFVPNPVNDLSVRLVEAGAVATTVLR